MTHRFDVQTCAHQVTVLFQGLLDRAAFSRLVALCRDQRLRGMSVLVQLGAGTRVAEADLVEELVSIEDITLEADSPFLSRWIQSCREGKAT